MPVFTLPKSSHPDFAVPGVKPKGPVEIDRSEPAALGLAAYGFGLHNFHSNAAESYYSTFKPDVKGGYLHFNEGRDQETILVKSLPADWFGGKTELSIAMRLRYHGASGTHSLCGHWDDLQGSGGRATRFLLQSTPGTNFVLFGNDGGTRVVVPSDAADVFGDGGWHTIVAMIRGGNLKLAVDGVVLADSAACSTLATGGTVVFPEIMGGEEATGFTGYCPQFDLDWWGMWGVGISDPVIRDLHYEPYRSILKPSIPLTYFVPGAAAGGGFQAAWARNANTIIQQVTR